MENNVLAQLAALPGKTTPELKQLWRDLYDCEPPRYNGRFLERRLAYRIQEVQYGGLKPATVARLEALGEQLDGGKIEVRRRRVDDRPLAARGCCGNTKASSTA